MITQAALNLISEQSLLLLIVLTRFSLTFATLSFFRREMIPLKITLVLSVVLSVFIVVNGLARGFHTSHEFNLLLTLLLQMALGFLAGFILNLFIDVFLALGQIISVQSGLGFINLYVPRVGSITPLSHFFFITATVIFLALNGHLVLIQMIVHSFETQLTTIHQVNFALLKELMVFSKVIFSGALMLSFSALIALFIANLTLAVMTKFSPQLNIFSIGINVTLILGFFIMYLGFDVIVERGNILLNDILQEVHHVTVSLQ